MKLKHSGVFVKFHPHNNDFVFIQAIIHYTIIIILSYVNLYKHSYLERIIYLHTLNMI